MRGVKASIQQQATPTQPEADDIQSGGDITADIWLGGVATKRTDPINDKRGECSMLILDNREVGARRGKRQNKNT